MTHKGAGRDDVSERDVFVEALDKCLDRFILHIDRLVLAVGMPQDDHGLVLRRELWG